MIAVVVTTDGREDCLRQTLASFEANVATDDVGLRVMVNDNPLAEWVHHLDADYGDRWEIRHPVDGHRMGFAGAVQRAFDGVRGRCDYVFHLEDDFTFPAPVDVASMQLVLDRNPDLAQVSLLRQPWNSTEIEAGGVMASTPELFTERETAGVRWTEHRCYWTTNPSLYPEPITHTPWPQADHSEGLFHHELLRTERSYGVLGGKNDEPRCHHIGEQRAGVGY